jgi:hypothetical protein
MHQKKNKKGGNWENDWDDEDDHLREKEIDDVANEIEAMGREIFDY